VSAILGLADAGSDADAALSSRAANLDDANELNDLGRAVALRVQDLYFSVRRITDVVGETGLNGGIVAMFAHTAAAMRGAADVASELDMPIVLRRP
jgi:hypothetical protein